jgi:hypothetical protein
MPIGGSGTQQGSCKMIWATAIVDFASTATLVSTDSTPVVVTGARLGDPVILGGGTTWLANIVYTAFVSAADAVTIRLTNATAGALDPASQVFTVCVIKLDNNA